MTGKKSAFYLQIKQLGVLTTIPVILLVGPLLGYFAGDWADRRFRFFPWFTMLGLLMGFVASGREIFRLLRRYLEEDKKQGSL
jgi:F0F1-type ATP synthase assembly protein I